MPDEPINKATRTRVVELLTEEELKDPVFAGDFVSEGVIDHFRRGEVHLPSEAYADHLGTGDTEWFGLQLHVGILPPGTLNVTWARVELRFCEPVNALDAWSPNDVYSAFKEIETQQAVDLTANLSFPKSVLENVPYVAGLLPQLSATYRRRSKEIRAPQNSVIRAISDGHRRLTYDLYEDPKTARDPRQLIAQVLFSTDLHAITETELQLLELAVTCRCGKFGLRKDVQQKVDVTVRRHND